MDSMDDTLFEFEKRIKMTENYRDEIDLISKRQIEFEDLINR